jgi:hypothetical protein
MKTHTKLLNQLIDAVYALTLDAKLKQIHDLQMLAAEIKGRMRATCEHCDTPPFTQPDYSTPDDDGWIKNTGKNPQCAIAKVKFRDGNEDGNEDGYPESITYDWSIKNENRDITHYKPA